MSLAKIFTYYTIGFLGVTILIGIAEQLFGLPPQLDWLDLHGLVAGYLYCYRHRHPHLQP